MLGLGLGVLSLAIMLDRKAERDELCNDSPTCPRDDDGRAGVDADEDARTAFTWMTVGGAVGLVGSSAAAVLRATDAPSNGSAPRVVVGPTPAGASGRAIWTF